MRSILAVLYLSEKRPVKETAEMPVHTDLAELFERARLAREEAQRLSTDYRFLISWQRMRPRFTVRPAPMLDGED